MASAEEVIQALWRASRATQMYRPLPPGTRRAHLYALHALEALGGDARPTELAARSLIAMPNLTNLLREMESAGWIHRIASSDDRRSTTLSLTADGTRHLRKYYWDYVAEIGAELRVDERPEFDDMIRLIDATVDAMARASASP